MNPHEIARLNRILRFSIAGFACGVIASALYGEPTLENVLWGLFGAGVFAVALMCKYAWRAHRLRVEFGRRQDTFHDLPLPRHLMDEEAS